MSKRAHAIRAALFDAVTPEDIQVAVKALIAQARSGDVVAIRELFNRLLGKPEPIDLIAKVEELEALLARKGATHQARMPSRRSRG